MYKPSTSFLTYDFAFGTEPLQLNGCAWYRCHLPMKELEKFNWDTGLGVPGWNDDYGFGLLIPGERAIHGWDIINLKLIMLGSVADKIEEAQRMGQKIVVDIDDWFEGLHDTNLASKLTDPSVNANNNRDHYMRIIDTADAITVSTPFLYDFYTKEKGRKNVFLVRNGIDIDRWIQRKDHSGWIPTVGWVGATPWRSQDLESLTPFFGDFMREHRLPFHHSGNITGAPPASEQLGLDSSTKTSKMHMKPINDYPELFRKIDIGLVPLNDLEFNHAKSCIKGLEYAAAGVPFVASYSPEYELLEQQGVGRLARTPEDWIGHLTALLDPKQRKADVARNLEGIKKFQSMQVRGSEWNDVMLEIRSL